VKVVPFTDKRELVCEDFANIIKDDLLREQAYMILGGQCNLCSDDRPIVSQMDHIQGDGYKDQRQGAKKTCRRVLALPVEVARSIYQLLCGNCHNMKTRLVSRTNRLINTGRRDLICRLTFAPLALAA
jgi:hypothetical protein